MLLVFLGGRVLNSYYKSDIFLTSFLRIPLYCPYFIFIFWVFSGFCVKSAIFRGVIFSFPLFSPYPWFFSYFIFGLKTVGSKRLSRTLIYHCFDLRYQQYSILVNHDYPITNVMIHRRSYLICGLHISALTWENHLDDQDKYSF